MAKRYHDSKRVRGDHFSASMDRAALGKEFYAGVMDRRHQEYEDGSMIHEDKSAVANLPQEVIYRAYPQSGPMMPEGLDDSIRSVDGQMSADDRARSHGMKPRKA